MLSRFIPSFLALSIIASCIPLAAFAEGYIGEDLGTDIYRKTDAGFVALKKGLIEKRIPGSAKRINEVIKSHCTKSSDKDIIDTKHEFTQGELSQISLWIATPLFTHILLIDPYGKDLSKTISTDLFACIQKVVSEDYIRLEYEVGKEQRTLSKLWSVGLYSDGNIQNSSYDLMYDLERIHDIIFSRDIAYNGRPNSSLIDLRGLVGNPSPYSGLSGLTDRLSYNLADSGWRLINPDVPSKDVPVTSTGALCASGTTTVDWIDPNLINDLNSQTQIGTSSNSQSDSNLDISLSLPRVNEWGDTLKDAINGYNPANRFGCKNFFCINVDFVRYDASLLMGGKSYAIESILQQNLKIVLQFAGSSFVQAKHTSNFFELLLKNLNLPSMAHIGTVVTSRPPPILNLPGKNTPRWAPKQSNEERDIEEFYANILTDYGMNQKRQNAVLENKERNYGTTLLEGLNTDFASEKYRLVSNARANYFEAKQRALKTGYYDSFLDDVLEFQAFTKTFADNIGNFSSLVTGLHDIKQN